MARSVEEVLIRDQIDFLNAHEISLDLLFDVKGMSNSEYKLKMGRLEKKVAYNARPCPTFGHTLKNRHGHCIQCDTKHIAYIKRNKGFTYLACSVNAKLIKVGFTVNIEGREDSLIRTKYGSESDWRIFFYFFSINAAKIERAAQKHLSQFQKFKGYFHNNDYLFASELFHCQASLAKITLEEQIKKYGGDLGTVNFNSKLLEIFDEVFQ